MSNTLDFDTDGSWDGTKGPAIHAPAEVRDIVITQYRVEWFVIESNTDWYLKNHMLATVSFAEAQSINGVLFLSARLSMELGPEENVTDVNEDWEAGTEYFPGVYAVKLLGQDEPASGTAHYLTYTLRAGTTIGCLINKIISRNMHHFLFLPYTSMGCWKGCGDHALHCWAVFVRDGDITSENSMEDPGVPLCQELTSTYAANGASAFERVGRGWWLRYNPIEDRHAPEIVFTDAPLTYQLHQ